DIIVRDVRASLSTIEALERTVENKLDSLNDVTASSVYITYKNGLGLTDEQLFTLKNNPEPLVLEVNEVV
ncbi:hypothetical protein H4S00_004103, partial [Coemansia sp. D1744]